MYFGVTYYFYLCMMYRYIEEKEPTSKSEYFYNVQYILDQHCSDSLFFESINNTVTCVMYFEVTYYFCLCMMYRYIEEKEPTSRSEYFHNVLYILDRHCSDSLFFKLK